MGAGGAEIQSGSEAAAGGREGQRTEDESRPSARPRAELLSERNVHINGSSVVSTAMQPPSPSDPHARVKHNRPGGNSHPGQTQDRCDGRLNRLPPADVYGPGPDREAARQHVNSAHQMKSLSVRKHAELRRASPEKPGRRSLQLSPGHIWTAVHTNLRGPGTRTHQLPPHKVGFDIPTFRRHQSHGNLQLCTVKLGNSQCLHGIAHCRRAFGSFTPQTSGIRIL